MHDPERAAGLVLDDLVLEQGTFRLRADVSLRPGALTAIIGPSGAGKSTLLSAIAGFEALTGGAIGWQGAPIDHLPPGQRPVSILFQDNNLFPHLTIAQNIGLAIDPRLRLGAEDKMRIADLLARLGLEGMGTRKPGTLSGGQQSRAALGRVLVADRPIVLLDEPFAALGPGAPARHAGAGTRDAGGQDGADGQPRSGRRAGLRRRDDLHRWRDRPCAPANGGALCRARAGACGLSWPVAHPLKRERRARSGARRYVQSSGRSVSFPRRAGA